MLALFDSLFNCLQGLVIQKSIGLNPTFLQKFDFKTDEDKNEYSLAPCGGIVKFRNTLLDCSTS